MKLSTGLRDHLLATGDFQSAVDGGVIYIYNGVEPATADAALSGNTLLMIVSNDAAGTGITMGATPASGVLNKNAAEIWRGVCVAAGVPTFYRYAGLTDSGLLSTTEKRMQGSIGSVNADLIFSNMSFTVGAERRIDNFNVALPTA